MTLLVFVIILSILVLIHEFGHFIMARRAGVKVEEFGWGLPPRLFGKQIGETLYSINLLPFGGFVKLTGEDIDTGSGDTDEQYEDPVLNPRSFASKTVSQRFSIIIAGVVMNFLLAFAIFYVILGLNSFNTTNLPLIVDYDFAFGNEHKLNTVILATMPNSGAEDSGITLGEAILSINGEKVLNVKDVQRIVNASAGNPVQLVLVNIVESRNISNSKTRTVNVTPQKTEDNTYALGVYLGSSVVISYDTPLLKLFAGPAHSYNVLSYSMHTLKQMIAISFENKDIAPISSSVAGPVGIYQVIGSILKFQNKEAFLALLDFMGLMSLSLGFMNILPFPALDGGRLVFIAVEGITKKKVSPVIESAVHRIGMIILLLFIVLVTLKDFLL